jgi:membrane associated rhomboid family serine protease
MVLVFTIDRIGLAWFGNDFLRRYLLLSPEGLGEGNVWQLVSYMFMHEDIGHIFWNGLVLFFISGVVGALVWLSVNFNRSFVVLLGASAGCLGIFSYFCMVCENRPMVFLLFFVIPIRVKPRMLLMITAGLEAFCFFTQELVRSNVANSAHLGGILGGLGCYYFYRYRRRYAKIIEEKLTKRGCMVDAVADDSYKLYVKSYSAQRSEIDRILDKINERGFKSLTEAEKNTLNSAKHLMHR